MVGIQDSVYKLDAPSYINSVLSILTRFDEQQSRLPSQRRISMTDSSPIFDPLLSEDDAVRIRFHGFVQTLSFLTLGNNNTLCHILQRCIEMYVHLSVCIDLTTSDEEEIPPLNES